MSIEVGDWPYQSKAQWYSMVKNRQQELSSNKLPFLSIGYVGTQELPLGPEKGKQKVAESESQLSKHGIYCA